MCSQDWTPAQAGQRQARSIKRASTILRQNKEPATSMAVGSSIERSRRRPTLPHSCPCSTIGPEGLNFRVRDGNGCGPLGIATEKSVVRTGLNQPLRSISRQLHSFRFVVVDFIVRGVGLPPPVNQFFMVKPHGRLVPVS